MVAAVCSVGGVTDRVRRFERTAHQIAASPHMSSPRQDDISEVHIRSCLEARQATLFDKVIAQLAESKSSPVVAETWSSDQTKQDISEARAVTVAALEADNY